jgi:hypothetical protein
MHAGNVVSLVKRTLFEANSKARRLGKADLTSVQTGRLLLATRQTVNPAALQIPPLPGRGSHACSACNILAPFWAREEESDPLATVALTGFVQKQAKAPLETPIPKESALARPDKRQ